MKFKILYKNNGKLYKLWEVNRTPTDLYFNDLRDKKSHFSYHESGNSHGKSDITRKFPELTVEKQRQPLSKFNGPEPLVQLFLIQNGAPDPKNCVSLQENEDIVLDLDVKLPVGIEIILSDNKIDLPPLQDRLTDKIYYKENINPILIIEVYSLINNSITIPRFTKKHPFSFGN